MLEIDTVSTVHTCPSVGTVRAVNTQENVKKYSYKITCELLDGRMAGMLCGNYSLFETK